MGRRWNCTRPETLPEIEKSREFLRLGNISASLGELDRADQICRNMGVGHPLAEESAKQRYFVLKSSPQPAHQALVVKVLERMVDHLPPSASAAAWNQTLHEELILSGDSSRSKALLERWRSQEQHPEVGQSYLLR